MPIKLSNRSDISVFRALDILRIANERIAQGEDIIHLEAGQPNNGAPLAALEAFKGRLDANPRMGYTEAIGMPDLRKRIQQWYRDIYGVEIADINQIIVTMGASGAFLLGFLGMFDAGDKVCMGAPGYPAYRNILQALDITPVEILTRLENDYQPSVDELEQKWQEEGGFEGLIIASPSNPTGTIIPRDKLSAIAKWCEDKKIRLISDELYHGVVFDQDKCDDNDKTQTTLNLAPNGIVVNSFSKYFAMTGWRLGWMVVPQDVAPRIKSLAESLFVSASTPSQHLAIEIFNYTDKLDEYVGVYEDNLNILMRELPKCGFTDLSQTKGAFYIYANIEGFGIDSEDLCRELLDQAKIAMTPGVDFDLERGTKTVRISFAGKTEEIEEACRRLQKWYQERDNYSAINSAPANKIR